MEMTVFVLYSDIVEDSLSLPGVDTVCSEPESTAPYV